MLFRHLKHNVRNRLADDQGLAMAAVIGIMAVGVLLTTFVASSVVAGMGQTTATRADVQSQASADAGIAAARAGVMAGTCVGSASSVYSSANPQYTATVYRLSGSTWVQGCPLTLVSTEKVRIVSKGTAAAKAVGLVSRGDVSTVEVVLSGVVATTVAGTPATPGGAPLNPSGPAVYAFSSSNFGGSGALHGANADVMIKTGNVVCNGASSGISDLVAAGGTLSIDASCKVAGNTWSSGRTNLSGAVAIGGNVVANGVTTNNGSAVISGSVWSTADVDLDGTNKVSGNVTAGSLLMDASARIQMDAWIYGGAVFTGGSVGGKLTAKSQTGATGRVGSMTVVPAGPGASPYATPSAPVVPAWVDFAYVKADWANLGFTEYVYPVGCVTPNLSTALIAIGTTPGVIDARNCSSSVDVTGSTSITLNSDIAIIAKSFNFGNSGKFVTPTAHKLWIITPDTVANQQPTCVAGSSVTIDGAFAFDPDLTTMIYSPFLLHLGTSTNVIGQIYVGKAQIDGAANLTYLPVGLPGYNLDTGSPNSTIGTPGTPDITTYTPRSLEGYRNIQNGP
jgi:cytoskeletal protein CcmA (bactofilin family)